MKTTFNILLICLLFMTKMYAQTTTITLQILQNKAKTWQGIKLKDKKHSKLSLASKLLSANKEGKLQAYSFDNQTLVKISYIKVAQNMELPGQEPISFSEQKKNQEAHKLEDTDVKVNTTAYYFIKDISGANLLTIKGEKYLSLVLPNYRRPENVDFTVAIYKVKDIEKVLKYKIKWEYQTCETCNFIEDENTDNQFILNPSMPEFDYKQPANSSNAKN